MLAHTSREPQTHTVCCSKKVQLSLHKCLSTKMLGQMIGQQSTHTLLLTAAHIIVSTSTLPARAGAPPLQATVCSLTDGLLPASHGSEEAALL